MGSSKPVRAWAIRDDKAIWLWTIQPSRIGAWAEAGYATSGSHVEREHGLRAVRVIVTEDTEEKPS